MMNRRLTILFAAIATIVVAVGGCGSSAPRQDAAEAEGEYPVEIRKAEFATEQRLAETSELVLEIENTGEETIPNLAITITIDDGTADGSFSIRDPQPGLANPNRPVWILEAGYPRGVDDPKPKGLSGATVAQTNTFAFGELAPGDSKELVWRVTPVKVGNYTVNYVVSAGLYGNAVAVTDSGGEPSGEIIATISGEPPQTKVNGKGEVVEVKG